MERFDYRRAGDSGEAFRLAEDGPRASPWLAGGTDLIPLMKDGVLHPQRVVDIKRAADLDAGIHVSKGRISIGALATLGDVARNPEVQRHVPLLGDAARSAASPQLRTMATVAGNLLQRPRCWYFRNPAFHCWLEGGDACPAREGRNDRHAIFEPPAGDPCCAVHPSDLAPALMAVDAQVVLRDAAGGERSVAVEDLFRWPTPRRRSETVLDGELVCAIRVPALPAGSRTAFRKAMSRRSWSFALSAVAARLDIRDGRIADARVVLGGVAGIPRRAGQAEAELRGAEPSGAVWRRAAHAAVADARPLAHNGYKVPLTRGLVLRTLEDLLA